MYYLIMLYFEILAECSVAYSHFEVLKMETNEQTFWSAGVCKCTVSHLTERRI